MGRAEEVETYEVEVVPVTPKNWPALQSFFSAKGCPGFCWCTAHRFTDAHTMDHPRKKRALHQLVTQKVPVGVLAMHDGEAIGWCSVAPRNTYQRMAHAKTMPVVDEDAWTILCLFVRRDYRGQGVTALLVDGALAYAKRSGAKVVEAYPWDTAGLRKGATSSDPATHFGHSRSYKHAGFTRQARTRRWFKRV